MSYAFGDQLNFLSSLLADSNTDSESMWPLAQRKTEINHAEKQFARDSRILMENTTGTITSLTIDVPSGWFETYVLYVTVSGTKYKVTGRREISPNDLERYQDYGGDVPYYYFWTFSGVRKIKLVGSSAINGGAYDFYYFKHPTTDLAATTDVSIIPEEFRKAAEYKTASDLLLQIGQYTRSAFLSNKYNEMVGQALLLSERWYKNSELPSPDFNFVDGDPVDRIGVGE